MLFSKTNRNYFVISAGIIMTSLLCTLCLERDSASAYTASITTNDSISFDISPSGDGTSIHSESINVQSDCRAGYNLTIATPEGSSLYKYENNTQSSSTASFTAVDGTSALSSDNNTNKWGYTLTSDPNSNTVFSPLSTTASILKTPSQTASPEADINDTFSINYGAKVDNTVEAGTYQMANNGAIVYYLTMDTTCTQYTVSFNANGGTGTMDNQGIEAGEPIKLTSADSLTAPQGASYTDAGNNTITGDPDKLWTFWGWNTSADGTGDWYKDKEAVENLTSVGSTITLYAQWKQATLADLTVGTPVTTEKVIDHNEMQDMSPETCYNSTAYSTDTSSDAHNPYNPSTNPNGYHTITLLDYRGKVTTGENPESPESYTVSKLPDNLCWMTKDLNLGRESGGENNNGTVTLTPDDTDITANFTLPASPTTYTTGTTGYRTPQILINHTVTSYTVNSVSYSPTIGHYSWAAATATNTAISTSGDITTSICPKNWDLPTRMQFYNLRSVGSVTSATIAHSAPYNFVYGGYRNAASGYYSQTSYGYYWTSSNSSSNYGYWNYVYSSGIYNGSTSSGYKYYGAKLRCVASNGIATINYDGNGTTEYPVTGTTAAQTNVEINTTNTMANGFTRTSWAFKGWNTQADGSGISIAANASISTLNLKPGETITLYAQWLPQYTVTYVNNCQTYASANSSCTQTVSDDTSGQTINLANDPSTGTETGTLAAYNKWTLTGWKIKGWSTVADNSDNNNIEYQVGTTYTVPSGSGAGDSITLYAHWIPVYSIQYDGNGASNPNGMGTTNASYGTKSVRQINIGEGDSITLLASNFKRANYGFIGWSTDSQAWVHFTDEENNNDPIIYGPTEVMKAPAYPTDGTGRMTLYAVWVPVERDGNNNPVYLQEWDNPSDFSDGCASLTQTIFDDTVTDEKEKIIVNKKSIVALMDKRDNQTYAVAKLTDGKCWMIENLRLNNQYTMGQNQNDNTVTNQNLAQGYGGVTGVYGSFVGLASSENNFSSTLTDSNSVYKSLSNPPVDTYDSINEVLEDIGTTSSPGYRFPRYNSASTTNPPDSISYTQNYINASSPSDSGTSYRTGSNLYSYGNYYTWAAAKANTDSFVDSISSELADTSLCPAGWHLPSSGSVSKEYGTLSKGYGGTGGNQYHSSNGGDIMSNRFVSFPNNFLLSGYYADSGSARSRGNQGVYWSRSSYDSVNSYMFQLGSSEFWPNERTNKNHGNTVRCLIDDTYAIQYDGNGADNSDGMGITYSDGNKSVKQTGIIKDDKITLLASNYRRNNYGFIGWSTDNQAWEHFTDNDNTNDPIIYGPMEDATLDAYLISYSNTKNIITLYAVWAPVERDGNNNPVYLQEWDNPADSTDGCATLTETIFDNSVVTEKNKIITNKNSIIALTDKRDNQVYAIAKLADGNCWMIENLRLEHTATIGNNTIDSGVTNQSLSQGYGGTTGTYGNFIGLADPETTNFGNKTISNTIYKSSAVSPTDTYDPVNSVLEDIGTTDYPGYRFPRYYGNNSNLSNNGTNYHLDSNLYSYGNYYTWAAAMANTNYFMNSSTSEAAETSICPLGWHLPSSNGATKEYGTLSQSYGGTGNGQNGITQSGDTMSNRFRTFPNNFIYAGSFNDSSNVSNRGLNALYWSRSAYSYDYSYSLAFSSTFLYPSSNVTKSSALSIRCLVSGS